MFRRSLTAISRFFPPKFVTDRLIPWATLFLAVFGATWALVQYRIDLNLKKVGLSIEFHQRYTDKFLASKREVESHYAQYVLQFRCEFLKSAVTQGNLDIEAPVDSIDCENISQEGMMVLAAVNVSGDLRDDLREHVFGSLGNIEMSSRERFAVSEISIYFNSLITCVEHGNCNESAVIALFSREMVEFVNLVCAFHAQAERGSGSDVGGEVRIAKFLLRNNVDRQIYWSTDRDRGKLFACGYLRDLEDASMFWRWLTY